MHISKFFCTFARENCSNVATSDDNIATSDDNIATSEGNVATELLRADDDKPTIGLLICREADKTTVEWAFRGLDRPLGVATYQIEQIVQRTILEDKLKKQKKLKND